MPIYVFECPEGHVVERLMPISHAGDNDTTIVCDECGQLMRQKLTAPGYMRIEGVSSCFQTALTGVRRKTL